MNTHRSQTSLPHLNQPTHILIVDDEPLIRNSLAEFLDQEGYTVHVAADGTQALQIVQKYPVVLALTDIQMPGMDGVELLERLHQINPEILVILITAYGTVETAVEAFQRGAQDYLLKPIRFNEVAAKIRHFLKYRQWKLENQWLRRELHSPPAPEMIIGTSPAMQAVMATLHKVARTRATVLILGESGTGKELIARALHDKGPDKDERFLALNCAAIPNELLESQLFGHRKGAFTGADKDAEGLFQKAGEGTLFLDEIGEMSLVTQAKILRAIEQK
ncbi:MAG TPA: sigma-54 dependent transcriptional regulator, partial [Gemmatales bacterium]|nr:sigma-54 dependent transcriptional regulator [Gemmatales bacterium]